MNRAEDPAAWIEALVRSDPDRPFMTTAQGRRYSYADLDETSARLATVLARRGVRIGDRVAAQVEKSPPAYLLWIACLRLGAIYVPLNTAYTAHELEYFLGDAQPRLFVLDPRKQASLRPLAQKAGVATIDTMDADGRGSLRDAARMISDPHFEAFAGEPDAVAALLYTSGTTGRSKGAMLTRRGLATNGAALAQAWRIRADDVLLHALPMFHVHGLFLASNAMLAAGASMIFLPRFDAEEIIRWLPQSTVLMGVPTFYTRLLQHSGFTRELAANIRLFVSGSAPLLAETHRAFETRTGHAILERYGMTETLVNSSNPHEGARVPGTVGPPLPGVEIRIVDLDSGAPMSGPEAVGMIEVRGPNLFKGYWRNPEKTAADMRADGFFRTGDMGRFDQRGYLHIVGRAKDLIITGGYNVYPVEIETEINQLPGVSESAVIGLPHPDFGEGVTAVVIAQAGITLEEPAILAALKERLAKYKLPKRVLIVEEFPRNALGKVQKNLLRERFSALYGS